MADIVDKWGKLVGERGFAQVPNHLLLLNTFLDEDHQLSATELLILIQIVGTWWKTDDLPFPSLSTLAARCGVSSRQVQRSIGRLETLGFIKRTKRRNKGIMANNAYDLAPLVKLLNSVAKAFPNAYPRNIDKAAVKQLSAELKAESKLTAELTTARAG